MVGPRALLRRNKLIFSCFTRYIRFQEWQQCLVAAMRCFDVEMFIRWITNRFMCLVTLTEESWGFKGFTGFVWCVRHTGHRRHAVNFQPYFLLKRDRPYVQCNVRASETWCARCDLRCSCCENTFLWIELHDHTFSRVILSLISARYGVPIIF